MKYAARLDSQKSDDIILSVLKLHYTDTKMAEMVVTRRSRNKVIAAKFQDILFKHWLTEKKTADGAFEFLLKSHRAHIFEIFDNLEIWVSFVTKLDKETTTRRYSRS